MPVGFIHGSAGEGTVSRRRRAAGTPDAEGLVTYTNTDVTVPSCRVCILGAAERANLGALAQDVQASILVPTTLDVTDHDLFVVAGLHAELNGTWEVMAVRHAVIHLRCLVRKVNV